MIKNFKHYRRLFYIFFRTKILRKDRTKVAKELIQKLLDHIEYECKHFEKL